MTAGGTMRCAYWGEILTATARMRGAVGAVVDGFHRDTPRVLEQNWPVFSRGRYAQDSSVRMQVVDYRCPMKIGDVSIEPGDLVFGDLDGVIVIPKTARGRGHRASPGKGPGREGRPQGDRERHVEHGGVRQIRHPMRPGVAVATGRMLRE